MNEGGGLTRLVVNADDFGLDPRVNEGIVTAHQEGIVTATSLMAAGQAFDHAVRLCSGLPRLDVGVHLTLVAEHSLLKLSSLTGSDNRFPPSAGALVRRLAAGAVRLSEVRAEWSAQIERIVAAGIRPSHIDSHQHVHVLPGLARIAGELARTYGIPCLRLPLERPPLRVPVGWAALLRLGGLAALWGSWCCTRLAGAAYSSCLPPRFLGFIDGGRLDEGRLLQLLRRLQPGREYELMCHPGHRPENIRLHAWGYAHERELRALMSPLVRAELVQRGVSLCRFRDLQEGCGRERGGG